MWFILYGVFLFVLSRLPDPKEDYLSGAMVHSALIDDSTV
jgi:hypothetical protein